MSDFTVDNTSNNTVIVSSTSAGITTIPSVNTSGFTIVPTGSAIGNSTTPTVTPPSNNSETPGDLRAFKKRQVVKLGGLGNPNAAHHYRENRIDIYYGWLSAFGYDFLNDSVWLITNGCRKDSSWIRCRCLSSFKVDVPKGYEHHWASVKGLLDTKAIWIRKDLVVDEFKFSTLKTRNTWLKLQQKEHLIALFDKAPRKKKAVPLPTVSVTPSEVPVNIPTAPENKV